MMKKRVMTGLLVLTMVTSFLAGCGKEKQPAKDEGPQYMYQGKFEKFEEMGKNGYISAGPIIQEGKAYYISGNYDEETMQSQFEWCVKDMASGDSSRQPVEVAESEYISRMTVDPSGNLYVCKVSYGDENDFEAKTNYILMQMSEDGKTQKEWNVSEKMDDEDRYISDIIFDAEGTAYLMTDQKVYAYDLANDKVLFTIDSGWVQSACSGEDGIYICTWDQEQKIDHISTKEQKIDRTVMNISQMDIRALSMGKNGKLYLNSGSAVYEINAQDGTMEKVMDWLDADIDGDEIATYEIRENGDVFVVTQDYENDHVTYEMATLVKTEVTPENQRIILTYGTNYISYGMKKYIVKFNKTNGVYRIKIKDYSENGSDSGETFASRLNADLMGSNAPDIIDLKEINMEQLVNQGYLVDLTSMFDKDSEIHREDYYHTAFDAGTVNGKLYGIIPKVNINSMVAKKSVVGDTSNWGLKEFADFVKNRPEGTEILEYGTKSSVLQTFLAYDKGAFIDWEKGTCNFQSEEFCDMLSMCNEFPLDFDSNPDNDSLPSKVRDNRILMWSSYLSESTEVQVANKVAGDEISWIGYPMGDGMKPVMVPSEVSIGVTTNCVDKDGAWEFIRQMLLDDCQNDYSFGWGFPIKKSALDQKLAKDMEKEYYTDENGEKQEMSKGGYGYEDGTTIEVFAITQEEADVMKQLMENAVGSSGNDEKLMGIIDEEAQAYFHGQKSLEETAAVIQSRVSIYVNESM